MLRIFFLVLRSELLNICDLTLCIMEFIIIFFVFFFYIIGGIEKIYVSLFYSCDNLHPWSKSKGNKNKFTNGYKCEKKMTIHYYIILHMKEKQLHRL